MIARRGVLGLLSGAAIALLGGCDLFGDRARYRFRMTVEVTTPQGLRTGSSVYEVEARKSTPLTSEEKPGSVASRGQATIVDLPGGLLFLLLETNIANFDLGSAATQALIPEFGSGRVEDFIAAVGALGRTNGVKAELPRKDWPLMVQFGNLDDPKSVEKVDPSLIGVSRILLETTNNPVTTGIQSRLTWLRPEGLSLDPSGGIDFSGHPSFAKQIRHRMFKSDWQ
jgi:hypothetical protein